MYIPIHPSAAGSLPASSPYRKGAERRFEAAADLLADRLAVGPFGLAAQGRDALVPGVRWPSCQGSLARSDLPEGLGWRAHPNPPPWHAKRPRWGVAPATAAGSGAAQPPRRPWHNCNPDNGMRRRGSARPERVYVHMAPDVDVHPVNGHRQQGPRPGNSPSEPD